MHGLTARTAELTKQTKQTDAGYGLSRSILLATVQDTSRHNRNSPFPQPILNRGNHQDHDDLFSFKHLYG